MTISKKWLFLPAGIGLVAVGTAIAKTKLDEFLDKSIYIQCADNAPEVFKQLFGKMNISVKIRDIYNASKKKDAKPMPRISDYIKITVR